MSQWLPWAITLPAPVCSSTIQGALQDEDQVAAALDNGYQVPGRNICVRPVGSLLPCMQGSADMSGSEGFRDWHPSSAEPTGSTALRKSSKNSHYTTKLVARM